MEREYLFLPSNSRIVWEETVSEFWKDVIKPHLQYILRVIPLFKQSVLWQLPRMRRLIQLLETRVGPEKVRIGPCQFVDLMYEVERIPGIDRDLRYLKWIFDSPCRTQRVFRVRL